MYAYVSYSEKDKGIVDKAVSALQGEGFLLRLGEGYPSQKDGESPVFRQQDLLSAACVLLFLSNHSISFGELLRDIELAETAKIPVYTVIIGKPENTEVIERKLFVNQAIELYSFKTYNDFASRLGSVLEKTLDRGEQKSVPPLPIRSGRNLKWLIIPPVLLALAFFAFRLLLAEVPLVTGLLSEEGKREVEAEGFSCIVSREYDGETEYGRIAAQSKNGRALKNSTVILTESLGPEENLTDIPSVVGLSAADGVELLLQGGMKRIVLLPVSSQLFAESYISGQNLTPGLKLSGNNEMVLEVAVGQKGTELTYGESSFILRMGSSIRLTVKENGTVAFEEDCSEIQ